MLVRYATACVSSTGVIYEYYHEYDVK